MVEPNLSDEEFGSVMFETIKQINTLKRSLENTYADKPRAVCAIAIATAIASCMGVTESSLEQAHTASIVNTTLVALCQPWKLTAID